MEYTTNSPEETEALGAAVGRALTGGAGVWAIWVAAKGI